MGLFGSVHAFHRCLNCYCYLIYPFTCVPIGSQSPHLSRFDADVLITTHFSPGLRHPRLYSQHLSQQPISKTTNSPHSHGHFPLRHYPHSTLRHGLRVRVLTQPPRRPRYYCNRGLRKSGDVRHQKLHQRRNRNPHRLVLNKDFRTQAWDLLSLNLNNAIVHGSLSSAYYPVAQALKLKPVQ